ncbi:chromate resistance protein ChrB domain-containing protein [Novosphingobium sp. 9U]|uniref:chromate resistance protein ChrB domain-containing protein n=1 Tax=Novosphingobium sp. 9U TaxID=2653158 RepID=UPI001F1DAE66|nr:chromate resistance protein ChrB domain-containing protein [Novosphingobium sp. 9U]
MSRQEPAAALEPATLIGRTWVTRRGVHVDRIACSWLIRRFIDPQARFRFVDAKTHQPAPGELRFDMSDAEFTHEGDRCSFETLLLHSGFAEDPGLSAIAEIIHELDIADGKFGRPETAGVGAMLSGVCAAIDDDIERIARASDALDQFYAFFSDRKSSR